MSLPRQTVFEPVTEYFSSQSNRLLFYLGALSALAVIEVLFQIKAFGQIIIALYGIAAVIFKIKSDESFRMALLTFGAIMISTALGGIVLAQSFAIYAFLLLAIGALCTIRELWGRSTVQQAPQFGLPVKKRTTFISRRQRLKKL